MNGFDTITAVHVHVFTRLGEDTLGLKRELTFLILQIDERRCRGDTVVHFDLYGLAQFRIIHHRSIMTGTDTEHIRTGAEKPSFIMNRDTQIRFRRLTVRDILRRRDVIRADGQILHLP